MLSDKLREYAYGAYEEKAVGYAAIKDALDAELCKLTGDEQILLMLLYATLPPSDVAGTDVNILLSYIRHALKLRACSRFCKDIPEDSFIHYVFYPRINSEDLCDCRGFFHDMIMPRLNGLSDEEAVLEVNKWCAENMTYEMSDSRTENPLTAYYSGLGRCGEESTFAVAAYRSVGIPARQIYVPYWVHCDDNHAWVEVFVGGRWTFLGACEPEPRLNLGWFNDASSRSPLACGRSFMDYVDTGLVSEQILEKSNGMVYFNVTPHYTHVTRLSILVKDREERPVADADIRLEVVNMAALRKVFTGKTDETGKTYVIIGRTNFHLEVRKGNLLVMKEILVSGDEMTVEVVLKEKVYDGSYSNDYVPAPVSAINPTALSEEQKIEKAETLSYCNDKRVTRIKSYYLPIYDELNEDWKSILHLAGANAKELYDTMSSLDDLEAKALLELLKVMATKDYRDVHGKLLLSHLRQGLKASGLTLSEERLKDQRVFAEILNPRMRFEGLEDFRSVIDAYFSEADKEAFRKDPESLWSYIRDNYTDGGLHYYPVLSMKPSETLRLKHSDEKGRRLLFVAIMRSIGLPARISPMDEGAEYFRDGKYHSVSTVTSDVAEKGIQDCKLSLVPSEGTDFMYGKSFSLSVRQANYYQPLEYDEDTLSFDLFAGAYRLLVTNRLPNGSQLCHTTYFELTAGESKVLPLVMRKASADEMLSHYKLDEFSWMVEGKDDRWTSMPADQLLDDLNLVIYPEIGREPTEHLFMELLQAKDRVVRKMTAGLKLCMVFTDLDALRKASENDTYRRLMTEIPGIQIYLDKEAASVMMARKMFLEPGVWPLMVLMDSKRTGLYGCHGYHVGSVDLVMRLSDCG